MSYIFYFIVTILILVFIHELGHFLAARLTGMRVDVFAIGFGKRLFGWNKLTGFTTGNLPEDFDGQGNTDYRLSLIPFGGYVKIAGMVDESFDNDFADKEPKPDEFRAKSTPAKLFVITAGVLMNLALAVIIFAGLNYFKGKQIYDTTEIGIIPETSVVAEEGFRSGDKILAVNGEKVTNWNQAAKAILLDHLGDDIDILVDRNGNPIEINLSGNFVQENSRDGFFLPLGNTRPVITQVMEGSPAAEASLQAGDIMLSLGDTPVQSYSEAIDIISSHENSAINMVYLRGKDTLQTAVTPGYDGKIGIGISNTYTGSVSFEDYSLIESFELSFSDIVQNTYLTFAMIKNVIVGKSEMKNTFGGPITIAVIASDSADRGIESFLGFLAMLSLSLAILNILPLPVLDGGHFIIILIEGIMRREIPVKVKIAIQNVGFVLILLLTVFIFYNDILRL